MTPTHPHTLSLRFIPHRAWLTLGPGWAVVAGGLASGEVASGPAALLTLGMLWLLIDPVLGTIWTLLAEHRLWQTLNQPHRPVDSPLKLLFPYVTRGSSAHKFSLFWAQVRSQPHGEGYSLFFSLGLAVLLASLLGQIALLYTGVSILGAFWIGGSNRGDFWRALVLFVFPYLISVVSVSLSEESLLSAGLVGIVYGVVYYGVLQLRRGHQFGRRLVVLGQIAAACFVFALAEPLLATPISLSALFCLLLRPLTDPQHPDQQQAITAYADRLSPFLLLSLLASALAVGGIVELG